MRHVLMAVTLFTSLSACATDAADTDPQTGQREQAVSQIIGEKWDNLVPGSVDGQNGWSGNCVVVDGADKYLKCAGGHSASKEVGLHGAGSYTLLVDL